MSTETLRRPFNGKPPTSYISIVFYFYGEVFIGQVVVELQSCQKELTHAKPAQGPSGYSSWNVSRVCGDLSKHRKWSTVAARSSKPGSALGTSQSKLLLSARQVDVADNGNGNLTFVPTGNAEVVPALLCVPNQGRTLFSPLMNKYLSFPLWRFAVGVSDTNFGCLVFLQHVASTLAGLFTVLYIGS